MLDDVATAVAILPHGCPVPVGAANDRELVPETKKSLVVDEGDLVETLKRSDDCALIPGSSEMARAQPVRNMVGIMSKKQLLERLFYSNKMEVTFKESSMAMASKIVGL